MNARCSWRKENGPETLCQLPTIPRLTILPPPSAPRVQDTTGLQARTRGWVLGTLGEGNAAFLEEMSGVINNFWPGPSRFIAFHKRRQWRRRPDRMNNVVWCWNESGKTWTRSSLLIFHILTWIIQIQPRVWRTDSSREKKSQKNERIFGQIVWVIMNTGCDEDS